MPRLTVQLREDPTIVVGQPIRGAVTVDCSDKGGRCDGLTVRAQWRTHGRGNVRTGEGPTVELFRGEWRQGDQASYEFELPGVDGPLTYHGTELNVDWEVVATADIPWAIDPKAAAELILVRGETPPDRVRQLIAAQEPTPELPAAALGCIVPFISIFILAGLGVAAAGGMEVARGGWAGLIMVGFGLVFASVPCFALYMLMRNKLAASRLGEVDLRVEPTSIQAGGVVKVRLRYKPTADLRLNQVSCKLEGFERVVRGSGTDKTTTVHTLFSREEKLHEGRARAGESVELTEEFKVPSDAAPTVSIDDNEVRWQVSVHFDIAGWPDWSRDVPFFVLPR